MSDSRVDDGVIAMLIERFNKQRLPRALVLKEKVERGELLNEFELAFLAEALADANHAHALVDRHPECQQLYSRAVHLYEEIAAKALENESRSPH